MFSDAGYRVLEAESADEALQILESTADVRLLFTDVSMPGSMSGADLAHRIAEQWPGLAARAGRVGGAGGFQTTREIAHADRIDLAVMALDAADRVPRQLHGRDFLRRKRRRQFGRGPEAPFRFGQGVLPV